MSRILLLLPLLPLVSPMVVPRSIGVLHFNKEGVLFVGDPLMSTIFAYPYNLPYSQPAVSAAAGRGFYFPGYPAVRPAATSVDKDAPYNIENLDVRIASLLGTGVNNIFIKDLAIHPDTKEAYIAVEKVEGRYFSPAIVIINQGGQIRLFNLRSYRTAQRFQDNPKSNTYFWDKRPIQYMTFTDMEFHKGKLYVSGVTNGDFASTMRVLNYPFDGYASISSVEMYHTSHLQNETRAPIVTFKIVDFDGEDYLIGAYTCTPLVALKLSDLQNGKHAVAKTIAELGFGNAPVDLLFYEYKNMMGQMQKEFFISHTHQSAQTFSHESVAEAIAKPGILTGANMQQVGVPARPFPFAAPLQSADLNDRMVVHIRRDRMTGRLELKITLKVAHFRISDFDSEFEMPGFEYNMDLEGMQGLRDFQNMLRKSEGWPEE